MVKQCRVLSSRFGRVARVRLGAALVLAAVVIGFGAVSQASADDCVLLGGAEIGGECRIAGAVPAKTGSFTLDKTLRFTPGGSLKVGAAGISINITTGDFVMETNTLIDGNNQPNGAPITVTLASGNIDLQTGSTIRSNGTVGGFIQLTTASTGIANIDGLVESVGSQGGQSPNQGPGGGPITIKAGCELTISDTGVVSSRGFDAGADLVHLEGCVVTIFGLVESTAPGHGIPDNPANSCSDAPTLSPRRNPITRPGKPQNSTGCVEIWAGTTVTIDSTGTHRGEVNADIGFAGGTAGRGWIDILANGNIEIKDGTGNDRTLPASIGCVAQTTFAVHANGGLCQNTDNGGLVLIQSYLGDVIASGDAIQTDGSQASPNLSGGIGGEIRVEAQRDITFTNANVFARGDFDPNGGFGTGGKIGPLVPTVPPAGAAPLRAFTGTLSWTSGTGDARPTGAAVPLAQRGEINLQACVAVVLGASFPTTGAAVPPYPNVLGGCGGAPTKPAYVVGFPSALCDTLCAGPGGGRKSGQKFHDLLANGVKDLNDPGLPNWEMQVFQGGVFLLSQLTDANGNYEFNLLPGTYVVCEVLQPGWTQTFPVAVGGNVVSCAGLGAGLAPLGYQFTITNGSNETDNDFGNALAAPLCPQDLNALLTLAVDASGAPHGVPTFATVQLAYDAAVNGDVIGIFSNTTENITLGGTKSVTITQCTTAAVTAATAGQPVWRITSTGKLVIIGPDAIGGSIGWSIESDNHEIKGVRATGASDAGIAIGQDASGNVVSFNAVGGSGTGVRIAGDNNDVRGSGVTNSSGIGVEVTATANANLFANSKVDNNGSHGIVVAGTNNVIKNNQAGSSNGRGNAGDGIRVSGAGNTLDSNKTSANTGNGINVLATATNTKLKSNQSNTGTAGSNKENGLAEYRLDVNAVNQGGNKADNIAIPKTSAPTKCPTFAQASVCE